MAKNKKSFVLYCDLIHTIEKLSNEQSGELFKHILRYVNDKNPEPPDMIIDVVFEPIKQQLKRDLKIYENRAERSRQNGLKGGRPKTQKTHRVISEPKKPDNDNVNDNDKNNNIDKINFVELLNFFNKTFNKKCRVFSNEAKRKYNARLKEGYTKDNIANAMRSCSLSKWHKESNYKDCTLEFFSRANILDKYAFNSESKNNYIATK